MFKSKFDSTLDRCLDRLQAGDSVEECLKDYPTLADELSEPLNMASRFSRLPLQKPSIAADLKFQKQLSQIEPVTNQNIQRFSQSKLESYFHRLKKPLLEFCFMTFIVGFTAFVLIYSSNHHEIRPATPDGSKNSLTYEDLGNITYEGALIGQIELKDGSYPLVSRSPSGAPHEIQLGKHFATGDLDRDGLQDAAALLFWLDDSATPLWSLAAVRNVNGAAQNVATVFLGANLRVTNLEIINHHIHISVSDKVGNIFTKIYALEGSELVLINEYSKINYQPTPRYSKSNLNVPELNSSIYSIVTFNQLRNVSYPIRGRFIRFNDGAYHSTRLLDSQSSQAKLIKDGDEESIIAMLTQTTSEIGSIYYLSVMTVWDAEAIPLRYSTAENLDNHFVKSDTLGEFLTLQSIGVFDDEIVIRVALEDHPQVGLDQPLETEYRFKLENFELVPLSEFKE